MRKTPIKRKTPLRAKRATIAHTGFRSKKVLGVEDGGKRKAYPQRIKKSRTKKTPLKKLKAHLWQLCREIQIKRYGSDCYTCPSKDLQGSNRHLGHFISSSICSTELRYSLDNLRVQCYSCNIHKSGNWLAYERHLLSDGIDVQELKDRNELTKGLMYREDWYENKIAEYTQLLSTADPSTPIK